MFKNHNLQAHEMQAKERPDEYEKMETRETKDKTEGLMLALMLSRALLSTSVAYAQDGLGKDNYTEQGGGQSTGQ